MIGFIGLGVMGEPMCRNIASKSGEQVLGYDLDRAPLARLKQHGVQAASSAGDRRALQHGVPVAARRAGSEERV